MAITDIPALTALRTRMQWHQERQRVLAENIANSDTPNFKPRDLVEPDFRSLAASPAGVSMARTSPAHFRHRQHDRRAQEPLDAASDLGAAD